MKTVILFDIDGTLVRTNGAGKHAMETALAEAFHVTNILDVVPYSGRTDPAIGRDLVTVHDIPATDANLEKLTHEYLSRLPGALDRFGGEVLPGVRELLAELQSRSHVLMGLLTGNVKAGAKLKLSFFDLWSPFVVGGFGDGRENRDDVARAALDDSKRHLGDHKIGDVWVIGDTPHDITCARAIGAKVIAVATGWHELSELEKYQPDLAVENLQQQSVWDAFQ